MKQSITRLRPHHLVCLQNYVGKGYSETFTNNMDKLIKALEAIELISGCDEICSACPNNIGGICRSDEKCSRYDKAVLKFCGYEYGEKLKRNEAFERVGERILSENKLKEICADCQWYYICSEGKT